LVRIRQSFSDCKAYWDIMESTTGDARTSDAEFIQASRVFLREDYLPKLSYCLDHLSDDDLWWRPNEASNSIGNLILHLCGNLRQWIVSSIGGVEFKRDRDGEFAARGPVPKTELRLNLTQTLSEVDRVLEGLESRRLLERLTIQKYEVSTLQAVYHVVEHFGYHLGQILYIYKLRTGVDPRFYKF
jgi:uncharacterized damage-inducible protein DinB